MVLGNTFRRCNEGGHCSKLSTNKKKLKKRGKKKNKLMDDAIKSSVRKLVQLIRHSCSHIDGCRPGRREFRPSDNTTKTPTTSRCFLLCDCLRCHLTNCCTSQSNNNQKNNETNHLQLSLYSPPST